MQNNANGLLPRIFSAVELVFGNPLRWSRVDKSIAISVTSLPVGFAYWSEIQRLIHHPEIAPYANQEFLAVISPWLFAYLVAWAVLLAVSVAVRKRDPDNRGIMYATIQVNLLANAFVSFLFGPLTNPYGIVLAGACLIVVLFFELVPALLGIASVALFFFAAGLAENMGLIGYAPFFSELPFQAGRLPEWFRAQMSLIVVLNTIEMLAVFTYLNYQLHHHAAMLEEASKTDVMTGLPNRRHLIEVLEAEFERSQRYGQPLAGLMMDLDHFKQINDSHGHLVGDKVLKAVAQVLKDSMRRPDTVARFGGEEFVMLLPNTDHPGASIVAERLRERIANMTLHAGNAAIKVTISIGVVCFPATPAPGIDDFLRLADEALYEAKRGGRNRVANPHQELGSDIKI